MFSPFMVYGAIGLRAGHDVNYYFWVFWGTLVIGLILRAIGLKHRKKEENIM